jgi:predicted metallopeptidase
MTSINHLPNFLIIGAMKGGTTSLWQYVRSHPQVFMPQEKEPHFFSDPRVWSEGMSWYQDLFADAPGTAIALGEASTSYSKHPEFPGVPERIAAVLPDVRLIYVIRNPIDRMRSQYLHHVAKGREEDPVERALLSKPTYLNNSLYAMQIERYLEHFDRDRLLVVTSDDLREDRIATLRGVYEFLKIDPAWVPPTLDQEFFRTVERRKVRPAAHRLRQLPVVHSLGQFVPSPVKVRAMKRNRLLTKRFDHDEALINGELRAQLEAALVDDVRRLRQFLGQDFGGWGIG